MLLKFRVCVQTLSAAWKKRSEQACLLQDNRFRTEHCYFSTGSCFQQGQILIPKAFGVSQSELIQPQHVATEQLSVSLRDLHQRETSVFQRWLPSRGQVYNKSPKVISFTFQLYLQLMSATPPPLFGSVEWSSALTVSLLSQLCQPNL